MKVIFLDVDGVLNSEAWFKKMAESGEKYRVGKDIDPDACKRFRKLVKDTGAKVVLSSSWRGSKENEDIIEKALRLKLLDRTPRMWRPPFTSWEYRERGREVLAWLQDHAAVSKYAIIDDDPDFFDWQPLFRTEWKHGLTDEIAERVRAHLWG